MVLLGEVAQVKARFSPFGDSATLECKIGAQFTWNVPHMEINLDAPDGSPI